jgi:DNA-binding XRE family transcriptional regulator
MHMGENETLRTIGQLVQESRERQQMSQVALAQQCGIDVKTLRTIEGGTRKTYGQTLGRVERALGWRPGAIADARRRLENDMPVSIEILTRPDDELAEYPGVIRAAHLTDEELTAELTYRLRKYSSQADPSAPAAT